MGSLLKSLSTVFFVLYTIHRLVFLKSFIIFHFVVGVCEQCQFLVLWLVFLILALLY